MGKPLARIRRKDPGSATTAASEAAAQLLPQIGDRIRTIRTTRRMTLQMLSDQTSLTPSMLSLVERGRTIPSIGSLIAISHALGVSVGDLISDGKWVTNDVVVRSRDVVAVETSQRLLRRVLRDDALNGALISTTHYRPNTSSSPVLRAHAGYEHGFILSGSLTVELDGTAYILGEGDLISYDSNRPHRIWNHTKKEATALWINFGDAGTAV
ncbi:helix-turn-helix domain-containing protein [Chelatococcus asaccharovorans]|uniref:helix-turn-helix domain-containing protein n=1 Tax=Chelatococcus asaccharovorans TaxID=28210 RepID=UPI00224C6F97|nr:XRE family transcriptional regulator [Chelatococcus asaccharovorans]CAH1650308.1 XRE family transcriptional regulator [Chelatococcus asaccharovorans]CAH1692186.1 XRE family transcriptional regulator [Chelatococcus asaccharovorans]